MGFNGYDYTQQVNSNAGLRTQYGVILPPGARVAAYVRSTGIQSGDDTFLAQNLVTTLAAGLARVRSGFGDFVVCLPGHVESVIDGTTFSGALLAGTRIIGVGRGSNMPTFTWATAPGAQWLVNKADVFIGGLRLSMTGVNASVGIDVTGSDFGFSYNEVITSSLPTTFGATTVMRLSAGADNADISGNVFRGAANVVTADGILVNAAIDSMRICDNEMIFGATAATGLIRFAAAATNIKVLRNTISNTRPASVAGIAFGAVAATGLCAYNNIQVLNTGAMVSGTTGITTGATTTANFYQNFVANDPRTSGLLLPTADT